MRYGSKSIALTLFAVTAACTEPAPRPNPSMPTVSEQVCDRYDTCNLLTGSVDDCVQKLDRELGIFTPNERADVEMAFKGCLALRSCDIYDACARPILVDIEGSAAEFAPPQVSR